MESFIIVSKMAHYMLLYYPKTSPTIHTLDLGNIGEVQSSPKMSSKWPKMFSNNSYKIFNV